MNSRKWRQKIFYLLPPPFVWHALFQSKHWLLPLSETLEGRCVTSFRNTPLRLKWANTKNNATYFYRVNSGCYKLCSLLFSIKLVKISQRVKEKEFQWQQLFIVFSMRQWTLHEIDDLILESGICQFSQQER